MKNFYILKNIYVRYLFLGLLALLFQPISAVANHLVGGDITYKFISSNNNVDRYQIFVKIYRDCNSTTPYDGQIQVGFYPNSGTNPTRTTNITLYFGTKIRVDPPGNVDCEDKPGTCLEESIYTGTVDLPKTNVGYHMMHIRCCRNDMVNVPKNEGQTYYGFIPPSAFKNSSPTFNFVPAPYICAKDTAQLVSTAYETDGDSLVYELVYPFAGGDSALPAPAPPFTYQAPPLIKYNANYSFQQPFGPTGYAKINPENGILTVYAENTGWYAIATQVKEYRNGVFVSATRRDIAVIVIRCDPNPTPQRGAIDGGMINDYYVHAIENLTFRLKYDDDNVIELSMAGEMTDPNFTPKPTLSPTKANKSLTSTFSWTPACKHIRAQPYVLSLKVEDNGCPSKIIYHTVNIHVLPFRGVQQITGPSPVCPNVPVTYSVNNPRNSSFSWQVVGGTILSNPTKESIEITWKDTTEGTISVRETTVDGCVGEPFTRKITFYPKVETPPITGPIIICKSETGQYSVTNNPGSVYTWFVEGGNFTSTSTTNSTSINWPDRLENGWVKVVERSSNGCIGDTVKLQVKVDAAIADSIYGPNSVCPNAKNIDYWVNAQKGSRYIWQVQGGTKVFGGEGPHIKINWGERGSGLIKVIEITADNCPGDTVFMPVSIDYVLITSPIRGDTVVCEFTKGVIYEVTHANNSAYDWQIVGGTIVNGLGTAKITVDWEDEGKGWLQLIETAYDSVNQRPCIGIPVIKEVTINPVPETTPIAGEVELCEGESTTYRVSGFAGSKFFWKVSDSSMLRQPNLSDSIFITFTKPGNFQLSVTELSKDSCPGETIILNIKINPKPLTSEIEGPAIVCASTLNNNLYKVKGFDSSDFIWEVNGGNITQGQGTSQILVNWLNPGIGTVKIVEISGFGCVGDTQLLEVIVDSPYVEIHRVTTSRPDHSKIEIYWSLTNGENFNGKFRIMRKVAGQTNWVAVGIADNDSRMFTDINVQTSDISYQYSVEITDLCNIAILAPPHRSILLQTKPVKDTVMYMNWNTYEGWADGVNRYVIYRSLDDDTTLKQYNWTPETDFEAFEALEGYRQCFRVAALNAKDNTIVSWSNKVCYEFEPIVWVPNAFTPGDNLLNESFLAFAARYKTFQIQIYNRWGERIFESNDPKLQWDGTFRGATCQEGVYIYIVNVEGLKGHRYLNGTIHLIK